MQNHAGGPDAPHTVIGDLRAALIVLDFIRHNQGMTRNEWAGVTPGVSGGQLSEWLRGKHEPHASKLFALADSLGLKWCLSYKIENEGAVDALLAEVRAAITDHYGGVPLDIEDALTEVSRLRRG